LSQILNMWRRLDNCWHNFRRNGPSINFKVLTNPQYGITTLISVQVMSIYSVSPHQQSHCAGNQTKCFENYLDVINLTYFGPQVSLPGARTSIPHQLLVRNPEMKDCELQKPQ
jgi:hypothetical protein